MESQFISAIVKEITDKINKSVLAELRKSPAMIAPALMTTEQAANYMGATSVGAFKQARQNGKYPHCSVKDGALIQWIKAALDDWIEEHKE